ncbi:hypothetical protein [Klebsiella phage vB_Kpn-VAC111]|uniref:Uncharacterized protein n=1 Tax=Klebsiella phage vB_Kpn-VAC111 TaxID=2886109 RepID=A0A8K1YSN4_9CAUD|nr:hypothetical protein [Klebsiella phage vB_Kpn-VAC111]
MNNKIWVLTYTIGTNEGRKSRRLTCDTKEQALMQQAVLGGEVVEYIRKPESFQVNWPEKIDIDEELEKEKQSIAELESRLNSADKLQDSAFRSGLQHGFSLGQTDDQKGYEHSMAAYSSHAGIKVEDE